MLQTVFSNDSHRVCIQIALIFASVSLSFALIVTIASPSDLVLQTQQAIT